MTIWLRAYTESYRIKLAILPDLTAVFARDPELLASSQNEARAALEVILAPARNAGEVGPEVVAADVLAIVHGLMTVNPDDKERDDLSVDIILAGVRADTDGPAAVPQPGGPGADPVVHMGL